MSDKQLYGKSFEFDNVFFSDPKKIGYINLYQLGEVCFENGHEIETHKQVCHEITYIISGTATIFCDDTPIFVSKGDIILNTRGQKHAILSGYESKLRYFYMGFTIDETVTENPAATSLFNFYNSRVKKNVEKDEYNILVFFVRLLDEMYANLEFSDNLIQSYIEQILIMVYRTFNDRKPIHLDTTPSPISVGDTTYLMIKYIEDNILAIDNLTEISEHLGYSYNYLSHLFKRKMGISIQTYLSYKKISKSIELIDSGRLSMTDISTTLNYQTVQAFSKSFKKVMNMSPSEYKRTVKNKEKLR